MMRGEKFELNLDDEDVEPESEPLSSLPFVSDVLERKPSTPSAPSAPVLKSSTGFPAHSKANVASRFKQKNAVSRPPDPHPTSVNRPVTQPQRDLGDNSNAPATSERDQIDRDNQQRLADMSPSDVEAARQELMSSLDPALIQRILTRANIDSGSNEADSLHLSPITKPSKRKQVSFATPDDQTPAEPEQDAAQQHASDSDPAESLPHDSVHFPRPPQPPDLDPSSTTFLDDLHEKYFPSLPSDPEKLEWMRPSSTIDKSSPYHPSQTALNPGDIRFSFKGDLIPPREASHIPVSAGLHHHGDSPHAAGYTIPELAHLSRSTFAPQRCIAFQTLGRILYRLGKKEFGDPGEPGANTVGAEETMGELARGLWREVESQHVVEQLVAESEGNGVDGGRHVSARAYATEAVWLWRKGGGRRWKAD